MQPSSLPASIGDAAIVSAASARADHSHVMADVTDAQPWYPTGIVTGLPVVGSASLTVDMTLQAAFSYSKTGTRESASAALVDVAVPDGLGWIRGVSGGIALSAGAYKIAASLTVTFPDGPVYVHGNLNAVSTFVPSLVLAASGVDNPRIEGSASISLKTVTNNAGPFIVGDTYGSDGSIYSSQSNQLFSVAEVSGSGETVDKAVEIGELDSLAGPTLIVPRVSLFGSQKFTAGNSTNRYTVIGLNGTTVHCEIDIDKLV